MSVVLDSASVCYGKVNEDSGYANLGRFCALDGSGDEVRAGEGYVLQVADVMTVTCKVYALASRDATTGVEITPAPTIAPADVFFDVLQTTGWPTDEDEYGYNFKHNLSPVYTPNGGIWYLVEYKVTTVTAGVIFGRYKVKTTEVIQS